jgi:hypothetical protein
VRDGEVEEPMNFSFSKNNQPLANQALDEA